MAKNRELKTRADGVKQHYNTGTSVTPNAGARDAFYPRPARTDGRISHGHFAGSSHIFREAPEGYEEATVTGVEFQGFTRGGAPKYTLTADNGFTFDSQDDDLGAFRSASPEYPIRVAYSTTLRRNSDERLTAVTGEAAPVVPDVATAAPADTYPAPSGWARNADGGYSRASDLDEDDFLL